jgi:DNA polymerase-3 subunit gamma/tau
MANRTENTSPPQNPAPIPTPETNYSDNSTNFTADEIDINRVWEQVLARVRPNGTQSLLRQHGHLVSFSNDAAYVKINSQPLLNIVKDKVANIQEAFQQVFHRKVTVKLGVKNSTETNIYPAGDLPSSDRNSDRVSDASQQVQNSPAPQIPEDFSGNEGGDRKHPRAPENTAAKMPPVSEPAAQPKGAIAPENDCNSQAVAVRADAQDVANATGELVQIFDGEIVDFSDELETWESASFSLETQSDLPELSSELEPDDFLDW